MIGERAGPGLGRYRFGDFSKIGDDTAGRAISIGIEQAVRHLIEAGHRRIAYLGGPETSWISQRRAETITAAAERVGVEVVVLGPASPTFEGGPSALPAVLESGATAVIAYNDLMAIGLLRAAQQSGLTVPSDLSLIGFDDIFGAELCSPALTTVAAPLTALGQYAVRSLLADMRSRAPRTTRPALLPAELRVRDSTARAPRRRQGK